ncbi:SDR family oxidoreductase [Pontibacter ummariensis]|nr:SDR family oxidoreductase [Pontibacter ummariensis]
MEIQAKNKSNISIMGCGWLGLPLAERLIATSYEVKGSTTNAKKVQLLQQKGISPFRINLQEETTAGEVLAAFLQSEVLVLNVPPQLRKGGGTEYLRQMRLLQTALLDSPVRKVLFVSSTSVYHDLNRWVTENDAGLTEATSPSHVLLQAEDLFRKQSQWQTTVVRFAGLVGGDRHPGRFLAGKTQVAGGEVPVNLIHLEDCLAVLEKIIVTGKWNEVYNACADAHPTRQEFYVQAAGQLKLTPPEFSPGEETNYKLISSEKLKRELPYSFRYPDPMAFF